MPIGSTSYFGLSKSSVDVGVDASLVEEEGAPATTKEEAGTTKRAIKLIPRANIILAGDCGVVTVIDW